MSLAYLFAWMAVFLRSLGIILQLPVLAGRPIPVTARVGISVCLATLLAGIVPAVPPVVGLWELLGVVTVEIALGLAMGFIARIGFAAVEMAGRLIATEIGMNAAPGMGIPEPANEPLASLLSTFAVVLFFLLGGHHAVLSAFAQSFQLAAAGRAAFSGDAADSMIRATAHVLELGLRLAAPFIAMNFLVTLAFAALGRAVPKMNVFIVSFSARTLAGLTLLAGAGALLARYLFIEFGETPLRMLQMLPTL